MAMTSSSSSSSSAAAAATTIFVLLLFQTIASTHAWGKEGHAIIANIAYDRLSKSTRENVTSILFPDGFNRTAQGPASPMAAVASWADSARYSKFYSWTGPLHFVDVQDKTVPGGCPSTSTPLLGGNETDGCVFEYDRDCKGNFCAVGAVVDFSTNLVLGRRGKSGFVTDTRTETVAAARSLRGGGGSLEGAVPSHPPTSGIGILDSLKFLIHIVGDLHQPLHVSRSSDLGGNTIHVKFSEESGSYRDERTGEMHSAWNLHSVWDTGIIQKSMKKYHSNSQDTFQKHVELLIRDKTSVDRWLSCADGLRRECTSAWAEESFQDARTWAYGDENGHEMVDGVTISEVYFETRLPAVERKLAAGGVRLAACLEEIFATA